MYEIQTADKNQAVLRKRCEIVVDFDQTLQKIVREMEETMLAPDPITEICGVGLAANQVGISKRILLITLNVGTRKEPRVLPMINPEILGLSPEQVAMEEGCLSVPGTFAKVRRPAKVKVRWQNLEGHFCERKFGAWDARIFLHEHDHLEGKLFTDYLREK
jgi:peptide deformylase